MSDQSKNYDSELKKANQLPDTSFLRKSPQSPHLEHTYKW